MLEAIAGGDPRQLAPSLGNDLQPAAVSLAPELRRTLRAGRRRGRARRARLRLRAHVRVPLRGADAALDVAAELAGVGVCRTVRVAHGPVPGARVSRLRSPAPVWPPVRA